MKRMLTQKDAASYCGLPIAGFEREVNAGRLPCPAVLDGKERWDVKALDRYLDQLSGAYVPEHLKEFEAKYGPQAA